MMILLLIVLTAIGAIFYHWGGIGDPFDTKVRDFGLPALTALFMWYTGSVDWWLLLSCGLMAGALTTYWGFVNKWFNITTKTKFWWNWALHGFFVGLAMLPTAISFDMIPGFIVRTVFLTISVAAWSEYHDDVRWEESGRGALMMASLIFLT